LAGVFRRLNRHVRKGTSPSAVVSTLLTRRVSSAPKAVRPPRRQEEITEGNRGNRVQVRSLIGKNQTTNRGKTTTQLEYLLCFLRCLLLKKLRARTLKFQIPRSPLRSRNLFEPVPFVVGRSVEQTKKRRLNSLGDGTARTGTNFDSIHRPNRSDLGGCAGHEHFIGNIH